MPVCGRSSNIEFPKQIDFAAGLAGLAGGSTACDDGALRCCGAASGAGSTALVAEPLAMALRYAGRSSDSPPQAAPE
jgi:hypothetical protein